MSPKASTFASFEESSGTSCTVSFLMRMRCFIQKSRMDGMHAFMHSYRGRSNICFRMKSYNISMHAHQFTSFSYSDESGVSWRGKPVRSIGSYNYWRGADRSPDVFATKKKKKTRAAARLSRRSIFHVKLSVIISRYV